MTVSMPLQKNKNELETKEFGRELGRLGFHFFTGVPCSFLKSLINYSINHLRYIAASNEGDAVAIAAGAYLGGVKSAVLMQNSGLTNAISPLTSLIYPFQIPILGFVSLRGAPGLQDEPQHELMGEITTKLLEAMKIKWDYLSNNIEEAKEQLKKANQCIEDDKPFFFVVRKGTFAEEALTEVTIPTVKNEHKIVESKKSERPMRWEVLETINTLKDKTTVLIATTGVTGRELYEIEDAENNLYMVGSMGCASSLGLGLALTQTDKKVIVIDGDGALLMRMGALATNAAYGPRNFLHILLDNNTHESTGGQDTASHNVHFVEAAASCGYHNALFAHDLNEFSGYLSHWHKEPSLSFLHFKIKKGIKENLSRPVVKPFEVKNRLMEFLGAAK